MSKLFEPLAVGELELPNRIVMAPLTRNRATHAGPRAQRADARVLRAAGVGGHDPDGGDLGGAQGVGYPARPASGRRSRWRAGRPSPGPCTTQGGRILLQLWHVGRDLAFPLPADGAPPVAPERHSARRPREPDPAADAVRDAARARDARDCRHRRGVPQGRRERQGGGLRRRGDPRRQRLPARPVPAGRQPTSAPTPTAGRSRTARACIWR